MRKEIIASLIEKWNAKSIEDLGPYFDDHVELRSTNVLRLFPDSNGVLKGVQKVLNYFEVIVEKIPNFIVECETVVEFDDSIIINSKTTDGLLDFHVQYYFDRKNKITLIKSDLSEKF
jgi:hypothetical protein